MTRSKLPEKTMTTMIIEVIQYTGFTLYLPVVGQELRFDYACFNTLFEISCSESDAILFESARYGRNNATIATLCDIPFTRNCDIDVHFPLNRACAGRSKCALAVNTGFFGDPCGYEEFLTVSYRCVQGKH